ncbi:unnamed protein product [Prunus armeniaca]
MATVMHILSYLKSASRRGLLFKKNGHLNLEGYTNTDYAGNITNRRSTLGYFTFVGGNLVHDVARSKMLCLGPLQSLSTEELPKEFVKCCVQHEQTKYVEVDRHFIKEKLEHKLISIPFVPSSEKLADMLTHALSNH